MKKKRNGQRVWVTCFPLYGGRWTPHFGTYPTRSAAIAMYDFRRGAGAYDESRRKGHVLAMRAVVTLEQSRPEVTRNGRGSSGTKKG